MKTKKGKKTAQKTTGTQWRVELQCQKKWTMEPSAGIGIEERIQKIVLKSDEKQETEEQRKETSSDTEKGEEKSEADMVTWKT